MVTTMSIRDLTRSSSLLFKYDYVEVENQKSKTYQGIFVPDKYAKYIKKILDKKIADEKRKKLNELNYFQNNIKNAMNDIETGESKILRVID